MGLFKTMDAVRMRVVCMCVLLSFGRVYPQCPDSRGTTDSLREIIVGRCELYQKLLHADIFCQSQLKNCTEIWENFSAGVFNKPPCDVNRADLQAFVESAIHPVEKNKAIFWEGVYGFVQRFSNRGKKYFALEDTLTGFIIDGTRFCGQVESPGFNSTHCATFEDTEVCVENSEFTVWTEASKKFAQTVSGDVRVMLNGTSGTAFSNNTIFASWELSQFRWPRVSKVTILMAFAIGQTPREFCNSTSLKNFQSQLDDKGIPWECLENPNDVKLLLCEDTPDHPECQTQQTNDAGCLNTPLLITTLYLVTAAHMLAV